MKGSSFGVIYDAFGGFEWQIVSVIKEVET